VPNSSVIAVSSTVASSSSASALAVFPRIGVELEVTSSDEVSWSPYHDRERSNASGSRPPRKMGSGRRRAPRPVCRSM